MKTLLVSGYKSSELGIFKTNHPAVHYIKKALRKRLQQMLEEGLEWVVISGQLGVELWAAEEVFSLQEEYPELKLAVLTPFLNQESNWNEANKEIYEGILAQADFVDAISKREYEKPWQFRMKNQFLVQKTDGLLLVYDEENPGSPKFLLETAKSRKEEAGYHIMQISFSDLQVIVEELQEEEGEFGEGI
ncbi:DUF1273 domain-containing protein [Metabacillus sp. RGM 3146]|uniref:DUF1273 domain-containing protein n=1 Tax=Metabacillus sp. RGM 3146 TaxID=3401092 RepID=UPI003B994C47